MTNYLYMTSQSAIETGNAQREYLRQKNDQRNWQELRRKHGYPAAVIYEMDNPVPYYINKEGKRCPFI